MTAGQIIAAVMNKSLRYDTATAFEPISMVGTASLIIVTRPDFPASNAKELVAAAKANPGKMSVASPGFGATQHMSAELFRQTAGIEMLHVPFRTSPEAITAVLGKQVDILFDTVLGGARSGPVGTAQGDRRHRRGTVPDGAGRAAGDQVRRDPGLRRHHLVRLLRAAGMPPEIVAKLNKALNESLKDRRCARGSTRPASRCRARRRRRSASSWRTSSRAGTRCARRRGSRSSSYGFAAAASPLPKILARLRVRPVSMLT